MFCIYCGRSTSDNATFCPGWGRQFHRDKPATITCTNCRAGNPDDAIFCWNCSLRLQREASGADLVLPGPPLSGGIQPSAGNAPMVQGTPQVSGVPMAHGTPSPLDASSMAHAPGSPLSQAAGPSVGQPLAQSAPSAPPSSV